MGTWSYLWTATSSSTAAIDSRYLHRCRAAFERFRISFIKRPITWKRSYSHSCRLRKLTDDLIHLLFHTDSSEMLLLCGFRLTAYKWRRTEWNQNNKATSIAKHSGCKRVKPCWSNCKRTQSRVTGFFLCKKYEQPRRFHSYISSVTDRWQLWILSVAFSDAQQGGFLTLAQGATKNKFSACPWGKLWLRSTCPEFILRFLFSMCRFSLTVNDKRQSPSDKFEIS